MKRQQCGAENGNNDKQIKQCSTEDKIRQHLNMRDTETDLFLTNNAPSHTRVPVNLSPSQLVKTRYSLG